MGGGSYDWDVAIEARSSNTEVFTYEGYDGDAQEEPTHRGVHPDLDPFGKAREVNNLTPIVVALDVTRSRGEDTKVVYEKLPSFIGQLVMKDYVPGPAISFAAIGDATAGDAAPLQVGQFEADNRLDAVLSKIWIEEGGGGTGRESYELAAYFYNRTNLVQYKKTGKKAYFFFVGDEGFYPKVSKKQIKDIIGERVRKDVDSAKLFAELQEKFHVFFIYPRKSWQERKADIDAEIKKRVEEAGGQYGDVDIRASLLWNDRNDLDLHVIAPSGERICFNNKQSRCGGWLDVDMNVNGETIKPVENIRWKTGQAPKGRYQIIVQNYRFHESVRKPTEFRVELEMNGQVEHFEGVISRKGETGRSSDVLVHTFEYDPNARPMEDTDDTELYAGYKDEVIKKQWASVLPPEHILEIDDPKAILDVMMGALALTEGTADLEGFLTSMRELDRSTLRQEQLARTLEKLAHHANMHKVVLQGELLQTANKNPRRKRKTQRLR